MRFPILLLAGAGCTASVMAAADVDVAIAPSQHVVVTATRMPTPLDELLAPVIVIDRAAIERSTGGDVTELLRFHAGLDIGRTGGPGQPTAVFIRGAESNHTLVLVDGVRINPGTIGLAALQNIPPAMVERIEIVKGPRSALYGSDAIGGVINVITRRGARDGWSAGIGYGDYDTTEANLNGGISAGPLEFDLGAAWVDSAGFPTRSDDDTDRGYQSLNASAQVRADVGRAGLALRHWRAEGTSEYSDFFLTPVDQDFTTATTSLSVAWPTGPAARATVGASYLEDRIRQNQSPDFLRTTRSSVDAQLDWTASSRHALGAGVQFGSERASSESYGDRLEADTDVLNLFVQDRIESGAQRALLALGYTDHETAGDEVTWNLEYGYTLPAGPLLYALAGSGFRAPDATDRYGFGGNPELEPERSRSLEFGVRHRFGGRHAVALAAFRNDVKDLIEFVTLSYDPFAGENRNVDEARIEGIEAAYEYDAAPWRLRVEATHQDPRNRATGAVLLRRARESLTVSAQRAFGPLELGLDLLATGDRKDFGWPEPVTLDAYVLANLTASWRVTRAVTLVGRVENLLDEQYELAHTFNTPDRGVYVSVRYAPGPATTAPAAHSGNGVAPDGAGAYSAATRRSREEQPWATD